MFGSKDTPDHLSHKRRQAAGYCHLVDNFCVLLRRDGHSQLVYKHAISTIMPGQPVNLMDGETQE